MTYDDLIILANDAAKVLIDLNEEKNNILIKYGERSALLQKKNDQLESLISFHDESVKQLQQYRDALSRIMVNYKMIELEMMRMELGMPVSKFISVIEFEEFHKMTFEQKIAFTLDSLHTTE